MVEVIVAMVILAVLAGAIAPRLASPSSRRARGEVAAVEQTLSAAALRASLSSQRIAIEFDGGAISVFSWADADEQARRDAGWRLDPLIAPAVLEELSLVAGTADLDRLRMDGFWLELPRTERRPDVDLHLVDTRGVAWRVSLPSDATRAIGGPYDEVGQILAETVIDLDQTGQGRRPW